MPKAFGKYSDYEGEYGGIVFPSNHYMKLKIRKNVKVLLYKRTGYYFEDARVAKILVDGEYGGYIEFENIGYPTYKKKVIPKIKVSYLKKIHRGKGIAYDVYEAILKHHKCLLSDSELSADSRKLWKKLVSNHPDKASLVQENEAIPLDEEYEFDTDLRRSSYGDYVFCISI